MNASRPCFRPECERTLWGTAARATAMYCSDSCRNKDTRRRKALPSCEHCKRPDGSFHRTTCPRFVKVPVAQ